MEVASCSTIATLLVKKDTLPMKMLVPRFNRMATPMTRRNRNGSDQAVVVIHKIVKIIIIATVKINCISLARFSCKDLFCTAIPVKQPLSPAMAFNSSMAAEVLFAVFPSLKVTSITAYPSL